MIAALYVDPHGAYAGVRGIDPWDATRDARLYRGPHPVVAHPPCKRWGHYWFGSPQNPTLTKGDDEGCFAAALWAVRTFGGVLEHPEGSIAWEWFGLGKPRRDRGWTTPDAFGGRSVSVLQGHYGHAAPKATWLYGVGLDFRQLPTGPSAATGKVETMPKSQRHITPVPFAVELVSMVLENKGKK